MTKDILLTIDRGVLDDYTRYYFVQHPKAKKVPIPHPYHESINTWMILRRPAMNALKRKWKDMITWFVNEQGYANLGIEKCEIWQKIYYANNRRHDIDNGVPKFILDGLVESGMIIDDDCGHVVKLVMECCTGCQEPKTELLIKVYECTEE